MAQVNAVKEAKEVKKENWFAWIEAEPVLTGYSRKFDLSEADREILIGKIQEDFIWDYDRSKGKPSTFAITIAKRKFFKLINCEKSGFEKENNLEPEQEATEGKTLSGFSHKVISLNWLQENGLEGAITNSFEPEASVTIDIDRLFRDSSPRMRIVLTKLKEGATFERACAEANIPRAKAQRLFLRLYKRYKDDDDQPTLF
jgi:hypothetical protein